MLLSYRIINKTFLSWKELNMGVVNVSKDRISVTFLDKSKKYSKKTRYSLKI